LEPLPRAVSSSKSGESCEHYKLYYFKYI
jgi:hypothetical protein